MKYLPFIIFLISSLVAQYGIAQVETAAAYVNDFETAKTIAKEQNKTIMMVFSGSDWCRPCMQFKHEILENEDFLAYKNEQLVVLYLDFPARKKNKLSVEQPQHNNKLAERFNKNGAFPKIILLDSYEHVLGEVSFHNQTSTHFVTTCQKIIEP